MEPIRTLAAMVKRVQGGPARRLAVAAGHDPATLEAAGRAVKEGICQVTLVADTARLAELCSQLDLDPALFTILAEPDPLAAGRRAVQLVRDGEAQVLMKGLLGTDQYMRCILDKERGLLPPGGLLTHLAVFEVACLPRLLLGGDVAIIPAPDLAQKLKILQALAGAARRLGIEAPKAAILAATEKVSDRMPVTVEAAALTRLAGQGQVGDAIVDGPLALDVALSREAAAVKGVSSPVAGEADLLLFPTIEAGNIFYKAVTKLAHGKVAAVVAGATAPCILTSRADDEESKFLAIVLGCLLG